MQRTTACRVLLEKKFPKVVCQVWSLLFSIMPWGVSLQVAATPPNRLLVYTDLRLIQNTDVFGRLKWSWPERSGREQTCFECGLHSQFGMAYEAMLLPDAIPMIFPLSKKAGKAPTKKRCVFKARKTQGNWPFSNTPMHNPVHFRAKRHVHTMVTVSVFTLWKHAVIFRINKNIVSEFIYWQDKHKNIKPFSLCLRLFWVCFKW